MATINENSTLLENGYPKSSDYSNGKLQQQSQSQQTHSHCIDVLEKPILNDYVSILDEDRLSADLKLEELLPFVDDPWWQKLRLTLFCTFVLIFCLILFDALALAYMQLNKVCDIKPISSATSATVSAVLQKM